MPLALLALFLLECIWAIRRSSTWFDESYSILLVAPHDMGDIARRTAVDGHPPLFYWILKPWLTIFGPSITAARAMSVMFMTGAFACWYRFFRDQISRGVGILTLALMVTNPMLLHYAVEARMYAVGLLLVAASCILLQSRWRWRWFAYWALASAMLYIHYFLAFVLAAEFLYLLIRRREQKLSVIFILVYGASILASFAPWIPIAAGQTSSIVAGGFWIPPVQPSTPLRYWLHAFLHRIDPDIQGFRVFPAVGFLIVWLSAFGRSWKVREHRAPLLLWLLNVVPWLSLFLLSCKPFVPIFHARYVIFGLPPMMALLAIGALTWTGRWRRIGIAILIVGQLWGLAWMRWIGTNNETRNYNSMKWVVRFTTEVSDGEPTWIVATWQFAFFDAKVSYPSNQVVKILRASPPERGSTDAIYYDKPGWWITELENVPVQTYWLLEEPGRNPTALPLGWHEIQSTVRGYVRLRHITRDTPEPLF